MQGHLLSLQICNNKLLNVFISRMFTNNYKLQVKFIDSSIKDKSFIIEYECGDERNSLNVDKISNDYLLFAKPYNIWPSVINYKLAN